MNSKNYYNPNGEDILDEKIFGGKPTGFVDFNRSRYKWDVNIYDLMNANTWFPSEVNTVNEKKNFDRLSDNEQSIYKMTFAQLSFNDCLIDGTEILTTNGFVDFKELTFGDKVANYHRDGGITFDYPKDIIHQDRKGEMYRFYHSSYEQIVTPNHRVVAFKRKISMKDSLDIKFAEDMKLSNKRLPISGYNKEYINNNISNMDRLAIAFQADGSFGYTKKDSNKPVFVGEKGYCYQFEFRKKRKIDKLLTLIKKENLEYSEQVTKRDTTVIRVWSNILFDKFFDWFVPHKYSAKALEKFIYEVVKWDGTNRGNNTYIYSNNRIKAIDKVEIAATLSGWYSRVGEYKKNRYDKTYRLQLTPYRTTQSGNRIKTEIINYEGKVHCVTVDTGMIICKYNKNVFVTGNSAQEEYLSDFRRLATNRLVKSTISLQIMQEVNHSKSYAVLLDACGNSEEVFNLYKYNDALNTKNQKISEQFASYIDGNSVDKMLLSAMASVNLEGIYFLLGFSYIYLLGDKVPGARDMIKFIARDELNTHLPLFSNIYKTIQKENKIQTSTIDRAYTMITDAVNIELEYGKYLMNQYPIMGITESLMERTVHNYANDRLKKIGLNPIFPQTDTTYLQKLVTKHLNMNEVKSNFFESNVANYAKSSINLDDF